MSIAALLDAAALVEETSVKEDTSDVTFQLTAHYITQNTPILLLEGTHADCAELAVRTIALLKVNHKVHAVREERAWQFTHLWHGTDEVRVYSQDMAAKYSKPRLYVILKIKKKREVSDSGLDEPLKAERKERVTWSSLARSTQLVSF